MESNKQTASGHPPTSEKDSMGGHGMSGLREALGELVKHAKVMLLYTLDGEEIGYEGRRGIEENLNQAVKDATAALAAPTPAPARVCSYCNCDSTKVVCANCDGDWEKYSIPDPEQATTAPGKSEQYVKISDVLDILDVLIPEEAGANHPVHIAYQQISALATPEQATALEGKDFRGEPDHAKTDATAIGEGAKIK
jgi:hypothetical protein